MLIWHNVAHPDWGVPPASMPWGWLHAVLCLSLSHCSPFATQCWECHQHEVPMDGAAATKCHPARPQALPPSPGSSRAVPAAPRPATHLL